MNILTITALNKSYGDHKALTDVDLTIPRGGVYGLLGPNGAGKTTLIRIVNQIIEADSGSVLLNGEQLSSKHIRNIGYLPEERGLYKKMKVREQLLYFAQLKNLSSSQAHEKVDKWLKKLDIANWAEKKIEDLSKGMAQKVQFISTVIHDPELLILDEPFSGFDPVNAEIIKNEILELKSQGTTVVLSTHRMESVELLCDHIAMINKSQKVLDGSVGEIRDQAKTGTFMVELLPDGLPFPGHWEMVRQQEGKWKFKALLEGREPNELLNEILPFGQVIGFTEMIPTIEEIFIQKVKETTP